MHERPDLKQQKMERVNCAQDSLRSSAQQTTHHELPASTLKRQYRGATSSQENSECSQINSGSMSNQKSLRENSGPVNSQPDTTFPEHSSKKLLKTNYADGKTGERQGIDWSSQKNDQVGEKRCVYERNAATKKTTDRTEPPMSEGELSELVKTLQFQMFEVLNVQPDTSYDITRCTIALQNKLNVIHRQGLLSRLLEICWQDKCFSAAFVVASVHRQPSEDFKLFTSAMNSMGLYDNVRFVGRMMWEINKAARYLLLCHAWRELKWLLRFTFRMVRPQDWHRWYGWAALIPLLASQSMDPVVRDMTLELAKYQVVNGFDCQYIAESILEHAVKDGWINDIEPLVKHNLMEGLIMDICTSNNSTEGRQPKKVLLFQQLVIAGFLDFKTFRMKCNDLCEKPSPLFNAAVMHFLNCSQLQPEERPVALLVEFALNQGLAPIGSEVESCEKLSESHVWWPYLHKIKRYGPHNLYTSPFTVVSLLHKIEAMRQLYEAGVTTSTELYELDQLFKKLGSQSFSCRCYCYPRLAHTCPSRRQEVMDFIAEVSAMPRSLMDIAALTVRKHLKCVGRQQAMNQLGVPVPSAVKRLIYPAYKAEE